MKYKVTKVEGRYTKVCQCCKKNHKRGYAVDSASLDTGARTGGLKNYNWTYNFVCSKKCADMYILARL